MSVGEYCNREVVITKRDTEIDEAAKLMRKFHVGDLVVVDSSAGMQRPIGIVTDRDLVVRILAKDEPLEEVTVGDVMGSELHTAQESDELWSTLDRMRQLGVRRMPVVDEKGGLVGILTADDVLELLTEGMSDLVQLIAREITKEREID